MSHSVVKNKLLVLVIYLDVAASLSEGTEGTEGGEVYPTPRVRVQATMTRKT